MKLTLFKTSIFFCLFSVIIFSQEADITSYIKKIESGENQSVINGLPALNNQYPNDPSVKYLEGVLQEDGNKAFEIFLDILNRFPKSKYADASAYRIYSYYYALGSYKTAKEYSQKLKKNYPNSSYNKLAERKIPETDEIIVKADDSANEEPQVLYQKNLIKNKKEAAYKFKIQAGAFSKTENANLLKNNFLEAGYETQIKTKEVGGTTFHVVYVGKFETDDEAKYFLDLINKKFNLDGRVISIDK
ncbi:MAG: SPOR domain-containing protein [Ignavibacteriaceae bacterium]